MFHALGMSWGVIMKFAVGIDLP